MGVVRAVAVAVGVCFFSSLLFSSIRFASMDSVGGRIIDFRFGGRMNGPTIHTLTETDHTYSE